LAIARVMNRSRREPTKRKRERMSETKCPGCGVAVFEKAVVDAASGNNVTQLVNAGDGKFHECPKAKPTPKPAAPKAKAAAKPAPQVPAAKPAIPPQRVPAPPATKAEPTPEQLATRAEVAKEGKEVLCESAIDIMASAMKMTFTEMDAAITKRMMTYGISRVEAVKAMAKDLNVELEKEGVPLGKAVPEAKPVAQVPVADPTPPAATQTPAVGQEDYETEDVPPPEETALATTTHDDNVAISEYTEEELERGVEVDFEAWAATASRSLLSVEKATKENLTLKFIKGGKVVKRRSKFEQEVRDKDGNVVFELDEENKPVVEPDGKGGFRPKVKKQRPIQDWVPVVDKAGVEYLLNVNPGMRKMLGKFKNDAGGTFDCWFRLHGEGRGKAYKCEITPVKDDVKK